MSREIAPILGLVLAAIALDRGIAARRGTWRGFERMYRDSGLPTVLRNSPFALIPLGIAMACGTIGGLLAPIDAWRPVSILLIGAFPILSLVGFGIAARPPRIFKPDWLQREEALDPGPDSTRGGLDVVITVGIIVACIVAILAFVFLVVR